MKLIGLLSLVALAYGYENDTTYIRVAFGPGAATLGAVAGGCASPITGTVLVKPIPSTVLEANYQVNFDEFIGTRQRHGTCISFDLVGAGPHDLGQSLLGTQSNSIAFYNKGGVNDYHVWNWATPSCMGDPTEEAEGFVFGAASGASDCGGVITANTSSTDVGITIVNTASAVEAHGTRFVNKRAIVGDLIGPFTTETCNVLANSKVSSTLPIVAPLEAVTAAPTDFNEPEMSTAGVFYKIADPTNAQLLKITKGAVAGQLTFELSSGGGTLWTSRAAGTPGPTVHNATFTMAINGSYTNCVQATDNSGSTVASNYYKFELDDKSVGEWTSFPVAAVPACPAATPSPAAGLKVSVLAAALIALVAMAM